MTVDQAVIGVAFEWASRGPDPGVVHQNVQRSAESGDGSSDGQAHRGIVRDVGAQVRERVRHTARVQVEDGDLCAARGEQLRGG
jgi:hypothetical protein